MDGGHAAEGCSTLHETRVRRMWMKLAGRGVETERKREGKECALSCGHCALVESKESTSPPINKGHSSDTHHHHHLCCYTHYRMADDVLYASVNFSQKNRQPRKQEEQDTEATRDQRDEVIYAEVKAANSQETQKEETEAGTCQPIKSEVESDPYSSLKWKRAKNDIPAKEDLTPFKDKGAVNEMKQNYSINEQHLMQLRRQYDILNREHSNLSEYQKTLQMNLTSLQSLYSNLSAYLTKLLSNYSTLNQENAEFSAVIEKLNKRCPISNSLSQSRICYVCPQNWMLFNSKCYSFSSNKLTWTGGVEGCRQHEAHLVIIESEEEQTFLLNELSKQSPKKTYWIGLNDIANEGQFVWVDNKRLDRSKSFWGVNWDGTMEPDNWRNQENCVKIQKTATASGWYDAYCLETNNVICERAAEGITLTCYVCPQNWMLFNSKCYLFSSNKLTWTDGLDGCKAEGAHLVIIESEEEQTFLLNEMSKQSSQKPYWIGLNDIVTEGQFFWVDNKRLDRSKSFWGVNWDGFMEPDNWRNQEDCVQIQKNATASGWYDACCSQTNNVICEKAAEGIALNSIIFKLHQEMEAENSYCSLRKPTEDVYTTTVQLQDRGASGGPTERICSYCPVNWLLFNFKCYFISNDEMNWWDSQNNCRSLDGHLVIIESEEEQKFLVNKTRTSGHTDSYYWIGLSDQVTEGDFLWVDGTPLYINLSFWGQMEPDNWKYNDNHPAGEDCVEMQINRKYYGWHDSLCHVQKKRICEREGQPVHE
ncbi:MRC1 protein, partial [Polypterus senegalus]